MTCFLDYSFSFTRQLQKRCLEHGYLIFIIHILSHSDNEYLG